MGLLRSPKVPAVFLSKVDDGWFYLFSRGGCVPMETNSPLWWRDANSGFKVAAPQRGSLLLCLSPKKIQDATIHSFHLMCVLLSVFSPLNGNHSCNGAQWTLCMAACGEEKSQENVWPPSWRGCLSKNSFFLFSKWWCVILPLGQSAAVWENPTITGCLFF